MVCMPPLNTVICTERLLARCDRSASSGARMTTPGGPNWAMITNLRMDPYERGFDEGGQALQFFAQQIWLLVPIQQKIKQFFADYGDFPHQEGSSLNASGINYQLLRQMEALKRLKELETLHPAA